MAARGAQFEGPVRAVRATAASYSHVVTSHLSGRSGLALTGRRSVLSGRHLEHPTAVEGCRSASQGLTLTLITVDHANRSAGIGQWHPKWPGWARVTRMTPRRALARNDCGSHTSAMADDDDARGANLLGAFAVAAHDRFLAELAARGGGSASRAAALATLKGCPGDTVEQMAAVLGLTSSGATRLVAGLVREGLVDKRPGADGRTLALHLTARGQAAADEVLRARHDCFEAMLAQLTAADRRTFVRLSERMLASLGAGEQWADHACRFCDYDDCPQQTCPVARKAAAS